MGESPAVFSPVVREDGFDIESVLFVERKYVFMQDKGGMVGEFARVQVDEIPFLEVANRYMHINYL